MVARVIHNAEGSGGCRDGWRVVGYFQEVRDEQLLVRGQIGRVRVEQREVLGVQGGGVSVRDVEGLRFVGGGTVRIHGFHVKVYQQVLVLLTHEGNLENEGLLLESVRPHKDMFAVGDQPQLVVEFATGVFLLIVPPFLNRHLAFIPRANPYPSLHRVILEPIRRTYDQILRCLRRLIRLKLSHLIPDFIARSHYFKQNTVYLSVFFQLQG